MVAKDFLWAIMKEDCFVRPLDWVTAIGPCWLGLCGEASGCRQNLTDNLIVHSFWYYMNAYADQKTCFVSFSITSTSMCIYIWLKINKKKRECKFEFSGGGGGNVVNPVPTSYFFFQNAILFLDIVPHNCNFYCDAVHILQNQLFISLTHWPLWD